MADKYKVGDLVKVIPDYADYKNYLAVIVEIEADEPVIYNVTPVSEGVAASCGELPLPYVGDHEFSLLEEPHRMVLSGMVGPDGGRVEVVVLGLAGEGMLRVQRDTDQVVVPFSAVEETWEDLSEE